MYFYGVRVHLVPKVVLKHISSINRLLNSNLFQLQFPHALPFFVYLSAFESRVHAVSSSRYYD